ncbi:GNAT family N-acetyltransferase [Phormidesmis priestleyi ANT.L61.2]
MPLILAFLKKKVEFDRSIGAFSGIFQSSEAKIHKTLFGTRPFAYVLFAETSGIAIGFALYAFRYSSFAGQPSLWLDDLYVDEAMRSQGAGAALMNRLVQIAQENHCTHLAWNADARNDRGLQFYQRLGATVIEQTGNRCLLTWTLDSYTEHE